jgi:polysaccharide export outer membrane protein
MLKNLLVLLVVSCAASAYPQQESLLIGPGDMVQVDVLDTPEMEQQARVSDDGTIALAYIGNVHIAGQTPGAAANQIQQQLINKNVMKHPQVSVRVQEYVTGNVSIIGQVKNPGSYPIATPQSILRVLSLAGGLTDYADKHVAIQRAGRSAPIAYYAANDALRAISDSVQVYPGDTIVVPKAAIIYVMGDVNRPGGFAMTTNDEHVTVMQVIALAGSTNKTSVESHVRLIRTTSAGVQETRVRLDEIEKGKQPDVTLEPNDVIYVPFSWAKNIAMSGASIAAATAGAAVYAVP